MRIKRETLIDIFIYAVVIIIILYDFICTLSAGKSVAVFLLFFIIGVSSFILFAFDKHFLTIDALIYLFIFVFCYYAPLHQYVNDIDIHSYGIFRDGEYIFANTIIIIFLFVYCISRKCFEHKRVKIKISENKIKINNVLALVLVLLSCLSVVFLQINHSLINLSAGAMENDDGSFFKVILKIVRYIPVSALLIYIYAKKDNRIYLSSIGEKVFVTVIVIMFFIVFFPLNGTMGRFLLFGTYITILASWFEKSTHKSYIVLAAFLGFYFVFPAFNFFKYNGVANLKYFRLGGFDATTTDYDAYQMLMQTVRHVSRYGIEYGKNIISALLCILPRSVWSGKSLPSGQLISSSANANFTNVSCPVFAEFYLAFGIIGVVIFTLIFASIITFIQRGQQNENFIFKGIYYIFVGIIISYMRGAMLPVTSFLYSLCISYVGVFYICKILCKNKGELAGERK